MSAPGIASAGEWFVKARKHGEKQFRFIAPRGGTTTLRLYASRWRDRAKADDAASALAADNPGYDFEVRRA